jgi:putative cell wall-binding protein
VTDVHDLSVRLVAGQRRCAPNSSLALLWRLEEVQGFVSQSLLHRRVAGAALSAALLAGAVFTGASPASATTTATQDRIAGDDRFETAAEIALEAYPSGTTTAIVATGREYADALAGAALAGLQGAPVLLTERDALPDPTAIALDELGVTDVFVLGGTGRVAQAVEDELAESFDVTRLQGGDRYATAGAIAAAIGTANVGSVNGLKTAIFATGLDFADALAGGPLAANAPGAGVLPVLLVNSDVPTSTSNAISNLGIKQAIVLGGTNAVSSAVEQKLVTATGNPVIRYFGANRWETATKIADAAKTTFGFPHTSALLANGSPGTNFADALAGAPLGGLRQAPVLLTPRDSLATETSNWLKANNSTIASVVALGGPGAIAQTTLDAAQTAATSVAASRVNETIPVTPATTVTLTNGATRDYTATGLGTTAVDIALVNCSNVTTTSAGNTQFANTNTNTIADGTAAAPTLPTGATVDTASTTSRISAVNGAATPLNDDHANAVTPANGTVTFTITGPTSSSAAPTCVLPVVYADANTDNGLNGPATNPTAPTEAFGTGGQTNFVPALATASTMDEQSVEFYTAGSNQFTGCTYVSEGPSGNVTSPVDSCRTYVFDSGDTFQLAPSTPISFSEFATRLSLDDQVRGSYNPAGQSTFVLTDDSPKPPTGVTATRSSTTPTEVTVSWSANQANGGSGVTGYRVYRLEGTCPATAPTTTDAFELISGGTITATSFVDTAAAGSKAYCYTVTTVAQGDESTPATPVAVTSTPVFTSASINTARTEITLTYNKAVLCSSVDTNGSSYTVKSGAATVTPTLASCGGPGTPSATTVSLTFATGLSSDQVAEHLTVTAKVGTDGDTVRDANSPQPVGDTVTVGDAPRFVSASTTATSNTLTLTYSEAVTCASVKPDDFTLNVTPPAGAGDPFDASPTIYTATCVEPSTGANPSSTKIALTFTNGGFYQKGQVVKVTAKKGADGNTVIDADEGRTQKQGDSTTTTVD